MSSTRANCHSVSIIFIIIHKKNIVSLCSLRRQQISIFFCYFLCAAVSALNTCCMSGLAWKKKMYYSMKLRNSVRWIHKKNYSIGSHYACMVRFRMVCVCSLGADSWWELKYLQAMWRKIGILERAENELLIFLQRDTNIWSVSELK